LEPGRNPAIISKLTKMQADNLLAPRLQRFGDKSISKNCGFLDLIEIRLDSLFLIMLEKQILLPVKGKNPCSA
jgi:hypothetical protein